MTKKTDVQIINGYDYRSLDKETRRIVQEHTASIHHRAKRIARDVWEIGKSLIEVKANLKHGQYEVWLKAEFGWSEDTALNFVNVAKRFPVLPEGVEIAPTALYLLSAKKVSDLVRLKAMELAEQGEKITTERAKTLIEEHSGLIYSEKQKPNNSGIPVSNELLKSDWADVEELTNSGHGKEEAIRIMIDLRRKWNKESMERKALRDAKKVKPVTYRSIPRITTKIKDELAELKEIADLKGEPLEEFLGGIIKNYRKKYK